MKHKSFLQFILLGFACIFMATSCVKEGPMGPEGPAGKDGTNGKDGKDASETCIMCHKPSYVDKIAVEFQLSKHEYGLAAEEEAGSTGCTPCHAQEAFHYVVENNVSSDFILGSNGKYTNGYAASQGTTYGKLLCATCHSSIHKTYASSDLPALTTVKPVALTMWAGKKTVDIKADGGTSNLCIKCHQPRPRVKPTATTDGNVVDYVAVAANPKGMAFDVTNPNAATNIDRPSYRMHIHYGAAGAIYAGVGGVEFAGALPYTSTAHTTVASCTDCHMGPKGIQGKSGGHTFFAKGNFTTCDQSGCHTSPINASNSTYWTNPRNEIKKLLDDLGAKLAVNGVEIMNQNNDAEHNLWAGLTTKNYDGYLNVYDPVNNPDFSVSNETGPFQNAFPSGTWTQAQKDFNATLPKLSLTNAQYGAIINFQMALRDYSLGIHNFKYTKALLTNSLAVL